MSVNLSELFPPSSSSGGGGGGTGSIEDGTVQGQVTTWDVAKGEWTPESSLTIDHPGVYNTINVLPGQRASQIKLSNIVGWWGVNSFVAGDNTSESFTIYSSSYGNNVLTLYPNGNTKFSGTVDATGFTINGVPISGGGGGGFETIVGDVNGQGYGWRHAGSTGNAGVFITNGGANFCPSTANHISLGTIGGQRWKDAFFSGTVTAGDCVATSDERLKDNITTAPTGVLEQLHGREWDWKESGEKGSGVVAQELEQVLPHLVHTDGEGMKSVSYNGLVAYLIEEVKALRAEVEALKT